MPGDTAGDDVESLAGLVVSACDSVVGLMLCSSFLISSSSFL